MMDLAGCPLRKVVGYEPKFGGMMLKLECGHGVFRGGMRVVPVQMPRGVIASMEVQCQTSPCYMMQRYWGD